MKDEPDNGRLERLQRAMAEAGMDALLLAGEAAGQYAAGHTRIGVHMPGWPIPVAAVSRTGLPHIVTADPDGALSLPADHVHGMMWNPQTLIAGVRDWVGNATSLRVGIDAMSPGGMALIEAAIPGVEIVDATRLLAEVMLVKSADEVEALAELCRFVTSAAEEGLRSGREAMLEALDGAFPVIFPQLSQERVVVSVRRQGIIGEARIGPGDPSRGEQALALLRAGARAGDVAAKLPPGVEVVGIGGSYEAPLMRHGHAWPEDLQLQVGAVLVVHWDSCGVTAAVEGDDARVLALGPKEVAR